MATFDTNFKAITQSGLLEKSVDTVLGSNVWTARVLGNAKRWRGETLDKSIQVTAPSTGGSFSGLDTFSTAKSQTKVRASFDLRAYYQSVVISGMEKDANASSDRSVELVANALEEGSNAMADGIGSLLYGYGTGNSNKDFLGLGAAVDDGSNVATYGSLSRSTYSTWAGNLTAVGGALTLAGMATMYDSTKVGSDKPTIILTTESIWSDYEALNQAGIRNNQDGYRQVGMRGGARPMEALKGELGYDALMYRGTPVVADEKATSGSMFFVNEKWIAFYNLPTTMDGFTNVSLSNGKTVDGYYSEVSKNLSFGWSGFKAPTDQYGEIGQFILLGNLVTFNPNRHGVLTTIS